MAKKSAQVEEIYGLLSNSEIGSKFGRVPFFDHIKSDNGALEHIVTLTQNMVKKLNKAKTSHANMVRQYLKVGCTIKEYIPPAVSTERYNIDDMIPSDTPDQKVLKKIYQSFLAIDGFDPLLYYQKILETPDTTVERRSGFLQFLITCTKYALFEMEAINRENSYMNKILEKS